MYPFLIIRFSARLMCRSGASFTSPTDITTADKSRGDFKLPTEKGTAAAVPCCSVFQPYSRMDVGTPSLRASSFIDSSLDFASSTAFSFWDICALYSRSSLSQDPAFRRRFPASAYIAAALNLYSRFVRSRSFSRVAISFF